MGIAEPKPFNASSGWLHRFKKRNKITNINIGGEEASADRAAARDFPQFLREVMEEGQYTDDQVFNMDESGLFWKKLPSKTFVVQSASKIRGRKLQKERITVLVTTNASGTCKPKLSVIHTARKPHAYKNVDMSKINVHWLTARKAWMFSALSLSWFDDCFVPDVKKFCEQQNVPFNILLLLDNAPGHSPLLMDRHPDVKVVFLPPNTTSLIQPMDQEGVDGNTHPHTNTKDELCNLGDTDSESKSDEDEDKEQERRSQPVTVALYLAREAAHSITAEGFSETTNKDILEVIRDPEMTADEMLEDDHVSEEEEKLKLFLSNDHDDDRYEVFHTRLVQAMELYIKVYQDNINTSRQ
ncbi:Tigger transposable element-derived protein 1-like 61 [Homarus americanus]|uniref:Tigger transposable element-derived protein 1-like 61 n=1 Tax=Homarus americanus TaxID=6706 RepID=A0A8J5TLX8_HOMAM|nr:Tigger transposable element-derived protein 1-like 61 [Homarus americanus]